MLDYEIFEHFLSTRYFGFFFLGIGVSSALLFVSKVKILFVKEVGIFLVVIEFGMEEGVEILLLSGFESVEKEDKVTADVAL